MPDPAEGEAMAEYRYRLACRFAAADMFAPVGRALDVVRRTGLDLRAVRAGGRPGHGVVLLDVLVPEASSVEVVACRLRQIPTIRSVAARPARRTSALGAAPSRADGGGVTARLRPPSPREVLDEVPPEFGQRELVTAMPPRQFR
jgi:hypothetical protein